MQPNNGGCMAFVASTVAHDLFDGFLLVGPALNPIVIPLPIQCEIPDDGAHEHPLEREQNREHGDYVILPRYKAIAVDVSLRLNTEVQRNAYHVGRSQLRAACRQRWRGVDSALGGGEGVCSVLRCPRGRRAGAVKRYVPPWRGDDGIRSDLSVNRLGIRFARSGCDGERRRRERDCRNDRTRRRRQAPIMNASCDYSVRSTSKRSRKS